MIIEYIQEYAYIIILNLMMFKFLTWRFKKKHSKFILLTIVECIVFTLINMHSANWGNRFTFISYYLSVIVLYEEKFWKKIFTAFFVLRLELLVATITFFMTYGLYYLAKYTVFREVMGTRVVITYISPIMFIINLILMQIYLYKLNKVKVVKKILKDKKITIYIAIILLSEIAVSRIPYELLKNNTIYEPVKGSLYAAIGFLLLMVIVIFCVLIIINYQKKDVNLKVLELNTKVDALQEHIEINKSTEEKKNIVLHDVKNHINIIKDLVSEGDEEEALEYIEEFEGNFLKIYKNKFSGNPLVNSILVRKQKICEENNIKFNVDCKIPSKIQIKQFDLSTVLCNLIDNAIEENLRCEEIEKRYIDISIKLFEQTLLIKIINLRLWFI
ncbi:MAG: GHKL domain-containing protein [Sarcina sp.]